MRNIALSGIVAVMSGLVAPVHAQIAVPAVTLAGDAQATRPISAAEAAYHVAVQEARTNDAVSFLNAHYPKDSMQAVVTASAHQWLTHLDRGPVHGIQLDPYGFVKVGAHQDAAAEQQIATRLATPGLSTNDKAYTYLTAVSAFTSADIPDRLPVAERYLAALDAMGADGATQQFFAHRQLASTYYLLGRSADVVRHGMRAIAALGIMEFSDRAGMFQSSDAPPFYAELIDAVSGGSNIQANIAAINATILSAASPSPALVARDSNFYWKGQGWRMGAQAIITVGTRVGTQAQDVPGNYWLNMPTIGSSNASYTMPLADGTIHILEMGHYSCPQCITSLGALQRLQDRFPGIRVVYATATQGSWGNRIVEPDAEAVKLTEFYTQKLKIRFPISLWKSKLAPTEDGGMLPENDGPNFANYPLVGKPNIYIVDGKGRIRRIYIEAITREREVQIARLIEFLQKETTAPSAPVQAATN